MLSAEQIEQFHRDGFLVIRNAVSPDTLGRLREAAQRQVESARALTKSNEYLELEDGHTAATPRLRRIAHPVMVDPLFWDVAVSDALLDPIADLLGPDVKFHHSKLNMKVGGGGASIGWHQDFAFFPHTNLDLAACGIALDPSTLANGCLMVVPGTHKIGLLNHRTDDDNFVGKITGDLNRFDEKQAVAVELQPGDMSIHHACVVHGSAQNNSTDARRLLIYQYAACDAIQLDRRPLPNTFAERVVRGNPATHARLVGPVSYRLRGEIRNASIFDAQKHAAATAMRM